MEHGVGNIDFLKQQVDDFPEVIVCFSHLRWDFVYQRPQHLLTRMAQNAAVYYIEEPIMDAGQAHYAFFKKQDNITVVVPHLPAGLTADDETSVLQFLLDELLHEIHSSNIALWYYTPMALKFSRHLHPRVTIFDCMDELSAFRFAPQELKDLEQELLDKADIVFTGGASLYQAKKDRHSNIHLFPSSIERDHFGKARSFIESPADQASIPQPRLGFFGVIDERFDPGLILGIAESRPDWHLVMIGPVVKIDPSILPQRPNIHYLGSKSYAVLPDYLAGWDIALLPFALNESTRFISPTKTPEYLAAGMPVITTPLADVIEPYGSRGLVSIAANAAGFVAAAERIFEAEADRSAWLTSVDNFLRDMSWDETCTQMKHRIAAVLQQSNQPSVKELASS